MHNRTSRQERIVTAVVTPMGFGCIIGLMIGVFIGSIVLGVAAGLLISLVVAALRFSARTSRLDVEPSDET